MHSEHTLDILNIYKASTADVTPALTIIIPDGDDCLIKVWVHYNSWLAAGISKGDLELFVSLHKKFIYQPNFKLDSGLPSRDGHLSGESSSREINTSWGGEWEAGDTQPSMCEIVTNNPEGEVSTTVHAYSTCDSNYIMHYIMDKTCGIMVRRNIPQHALTGMSNTLQSLSITLSSVKIWTSCREKGDMKNSVPPIQQRQRLSPSTPANNDTCDSFTSHHC